MTVAAIGIGGNLGDAATKVREAMRLLSDLGRLRASSHLYRTKPWGVLEQPDFYNAAVLIDVDLSPRELLNAVQSIEKQLGRTPTYRWGPRVIDIDILTLGNERVNEQDLKIPHPEMMNRAFVLAPLAEIDDSYAQAYAALPQGERDNVKRVEPAT